MLCICFTDWNFNQLLSAAAYGRVDGVLAALDEGADKDAKDNVRNPIVRGEWDCSSSYFCFFVFHCENACWFAS